MAAYRQVDDLPSPAGWLPVHRDQLWAQRSVSSMGKPLPLPLPLPVIVQDRKPFVCKDRVAWSEVAGLLNGLFIHHTGRSLPTDQLDYLATIALSLYYIELSITGVVILCYWNFHTKSAVAVFCVCVFETVCVYVFECDVFNMMHRQRLMVNCWWNIVLVNCALAYELNNNDGLCSCPLCSLLLQSLMHIAAVLYPLPWNRHHWSSGDFLEGKRENFQVCSVQYCAQQLCTVQCTHMNRPNSSLDWVLSHWAHFTVLRLIFVQCITVHCMHV